MKKYFLVIFLCIFLYLGTNPYILKINKEKIHTTCSLIELKKQTYNERTIRNNPYIEFCEKYRQIGNDCQIKYGVPTSIQLAQAIGESGAGKSQLAISANNLFGMKYYKELFDGDYIVSESGVKWRKYDDFEDSFEDHAIFLNKYYSHAVDKDWKFWVNNCKGYGAGQYWKHIGDIIELYDLEKYDVLPDIAINYKK